jgi:hypothetical protein
MEDPKKKRNKSFDIMFCHHLNFQRPIDFNLWEKKIRIKEPLVSIISKTLKNMWFSWKKQ